MALPEKPKPGWKVTITARSGSTHETDLDADWMPAGDSPPTPLEVAAKLTRELADEHRAWGLPSNFGWQAPLTITVEEV